MDASDKIIILPIGGLGASQMQDVRIHYNADPRCTVIWTSDMDSNAYKIDITATLAPYAANRVCLLGHSFAGIPILDYISDNPGRVFYAGLIDPVSDKAFVSSVEAPSPMPPYNWFVRSDFGIEAKLTIEGLPPPIVIPGGHNDLPRNAWLIAEMDKGVFA